MTLQGPATLTYPQAQTPYAQMTVLTIDPTNRLFQMQVSATPREWVEPVMHVPCKSFWEGTLEDL